jgi:hypothetical protein
MDKRPVSQDLATSERIEQVWCLVLGEALDTAQLFACANQLLVQPLLGLVLGGGREL